MKNAGAVKVDICLKIIFARHAQLNVEDVPMDFARLTLYVLKTAKYVIQVIAIDADQVYTLHKIHVKNVT